MKKLSNIWLLIVLAGLVGLFVVLKVFRSPARERSLPANLLELDTARVTSILIDGPKHPGKTVALSREANKWSLKIGDQPLRLEQGAGTNALRKLADLAPEQIATRKPGKWKDYFVSDSTGTHVRVMGGNDILADLYIGRSSITPGSGSLMGGGAFTYVRVADQDEVYTVNGFVDAQFSRMPPDWREKGFLRFTRDSISRVDFHYPDSSFTLIRENGKWLADGLPTDSTTTAQFLNELSYRNLSSFASTTPSGEPVFSVDLYIRDKKHTTYRGWAGDVWYVQSDYQPETHFVADGTTLRSLFRWKGYFLPKAATIQNKKRK